MDNVARYDRLIFSPRSKRYNTAFTSFHFVREGGGRNEIFK